MYKFEIEKMGCMSCVHHIEEGLRELDKVVSLKPVLKSRTLEVETTLAKEYIKRVIEDAGYQAKDLN